MLVSQETKSLMLLDTQNVLSLNSYEGDDENQARELSNIVSGCKQKSDVQKQTNSSPIKERLPLQASTSSNNYSTINNFTAFFRYSGFLWWISWVIWSIKYANAILPKHKSCTEPQRSWKRIRASVRSDSDED